MSSVKSNAISAIDAMDIFETGDLSTSSRELETLEAAIEAYRGLGISRLCLSVIFAGAAATASPSMPAWKLGKFSSNRRRGKDKQRR